MLFNGSFNYKMVHFSTDKKTNSNQKNVSHRLVNTLGFCLHSMNGTL